MPDLKLDFPVLLGPVRVETRYVGDELLIRVFPDEWSIDKFEQRPTRAELAALDAYWVTLWAAGGSPLAERVAFEQLCTRVAAGRAAWLLQKYKPANPGDRPTQVATGTTVLVVVTPQPVAQEDRQPATTYWTSVWKAHGDREKLREAEIVLLAAVGAGRAKTIRAIRPSGVDSSASSTGILVTVVFMVLTPPPAGEIAEDSWTTAAKASLLPDKFTAFGYVGDTRIFAKSGGPVKADLAVSPNPAEPREKQLKINEETGTLRIPDALMWLTEFKAAEDVGMGIRVTVGDTFRTLDRLVVLGLREAATPQKSAEDWGKLLTDQVRTPAGFGFLPQGTPTNNSDQAAAGQDPRAEAESKLAAAAGFAATATDWWKKTDGEWFAELLGLDPAVLAGGANAEGGDRWEARAAHTALWPATWGYYLPSLLNGVLTEQQIAQTRQFFLEHVSGRGPLPVVKIGRQPYGILPTTVFSKLAFPPTAPHRVALNNVLKEASRHWHDALPKVQYLDSATGDPHQKLLDILALHPTSAEYHQRFARSAEELAVREPGLAERLETVLGAPIRDVLARFGYRTVDPDSGPDLLRRVFEEQTQPVPAPVVDDRELSEVDPIRDYAPEGNYLDWLARYGKEDLDKVRKEEGFDDNVPPSALLYLLARHAVLLGAAEAARRLALSTPGAEVPDVRDAPFIHVEVSDEPSESRYRKLYSTDPAIDPDRLVHEHLRTVLDTSPAAADLSEQIEALRLLAKVPTARLERVFAEHLDCATYRLDAWRLGLVNERLAELRRDPAGGPPKRGLHLGAYGRLEKIERAGTPATELLPEGLPAIFGTGPLPHDDKNGGYIHAPSPAHARTAAVLRAGFLANGKQRADSTFAVNLSSSRVRVALSLLDGMRQGQAPGALLGYRFERGLHDRRVGLDEVIAGFRFHFPLRANKIKDSVPDPAQGPGLPTSVEQVEARNVIDGLDFLRHVDKLDKKERVYPFKLTGLPEITDTGILGDIYKEIDALRDAQDALADLIVAEGTHQVLQGNTERASATLDSYAKGGVLPEPAVVETPRGGTTLTHRLGLQFTPGLGPDHGAPLLGRNNPRARAEPAVNDWLADMLPEPGSVAASVTWLDHKNKKHVHVVTQAEAGLQAIDLLWAVPPARAAEATDLDDRILGVVIEEARPRPDAKLEIQYTERVSGKVSFFELSPLIGALRSLLTTARPLRPTDLVPAAGTARVERAADDAVSLSRERPAAVLESLNRLGEDVTEFLADLGALEPAEVVEHIDDFLARYAKLAKAAGDFGLGVSGWGELSLWRGGVFARVLGAVAEVAARMDRALKAADVLFTRYEKLPSSTSDAERYRLLEEIERLLVTKPKPRETSVFRMRARVRSARTTFEARLSRLTGIAGTTEPTLSGLLADVARELPLTDLDPAGLDLEPFEDQVVAYGAELLARAGKLKTDLIGDAAAHKDGRRQAAERLLVRYDQVPAGPERVAAGIDALKALLGEDVLVVPEFTPSEEMLDQWRDARNDSEALVEHLTDEGPGKPGRDFPVDDWLHGMARVREKPRLWEKTVHLAGALLEPGGLLGTGILGWKEPRLTPVQLPYAEDDHWLAMEFFDPAKVGDQLVEDRLLYTAHYAASLNGERQCGLLLDEWTEVVPAERETTGIALHYDGPDAEPPQSMLLVVPPVLEPDGKWTTELLLEAIEETFDLAKTRAVEPDHLEGTALGQFLPATMMSAVRDQVTISTDLAVSTLRWKATR
ncbi:hypothetical protein SD37_28130 [Amycolatopsis orientalis]|uniref:Uncharacterized protein n=1 Tax=Amycolatopsis orientalis TaxID=31958 RepID=A0A193C420_AMYOR|nr:hypothetical protein [Amycolatopsis orientalis]ANN19110.1 hypothetical protein SD37_28130 [Amycolatopsis orientalis]